MLHLVPGSRSRKPRLYWADVATQPTLADAIAVIERAYDFPGHPYLAWMRAPATTRDAFRGSQVPFRFAVEAFSQALAGVLAHVPRLEERLLLAENIAEEHGHGEALRSHKYTFIEYLRALGATREELDRPCPVWVTAFNHGLRNMCLAQPYEHGAAALGIIEQVYVGVSGEIARAIVERGWVEPGSQRHYAVHEVLDVEHARELLDLARPAWDTPRTRSSVAQGLLLGAWSFHRLFHDLLPDDDDLAA